MINQLEHFLNSSARSQWLSNEFMKVYVRRSFRCIDYNLIQVLDIATIEVYPQFQRQGKCSEFLKIAHQINPYKATFVENVLYAFLQSHLIKNGYQEYSIPSCFFKLMD